MISTARCWAVFYQIMWLDLWLHVHEFRYLWTNFKIYAGKLSTAIPWQQQSQMTDEGVGMQALHRCYLHRLGPCVVVARDPVGTVEQACRHGASTRPHSDCRVQLVRTVLIQLSFHKLPRYQVRMKST